MPDSRRKDEEHIPEDKERFADRLSILLGKRMYHMAGLLFVLAILFRFFEPVSKVLLIAFVGAILGMAFNSLVVRLPVSRGAGTAIVGVGTLAAIGLAIWFSVRFVANQVREFVEDLPEMSVILNDVEQWLQQNTGLDLDLAGPGLQETIGNVVGDVDGFAVLGGAIGFLELFAVTLLVLMGAFFVVAKPNEQLLIPLMRAVPQDRRPAYQRMFDRMGERLSGWLVGTLVSMLAVGIVSAIVFALIGIPYSIVLGVLNGLLNVIPLLGAWIGGLIAVIVTLFFEPGRVIWVIIAVIAIQELEGNLLRPMVMSGAAKVHPFVVLLALLFFSSIFGILGAILSIPLVLAIGTIVEVLWVEETLDAGEDKIEPVVQEE